MKIETILENRTNVAAKLSADHLSAIGAKVYKDYEVDLGSRKDWEIKSKEAMDVALQVMTKRESWSNVKFPLLTIASIQFSSRVYPSLINTTQPVKCRTYGDDKDGEKAKRAERVSRHMSYQVLEEDHDWEEEMDKLLLILPILGTCFKKSYFDPIKGYNVSELVLPKDLVVNYYAKSIETAFSATHVLELHSNTIIERMRRGIYREIDLGQPQPKLRDGEEQDRDGRVEPELTENTPYRVLEQHCYLDLDKDGYLEPYIVTLLADTREVLRIVPRFRESDIEYNARGQVASINARNHFTKYSFIPSPDGGFYDIGFGQLIGPINQAASTIINQLIDAGTLANRQSGFVGRGARLKGGEMKFRPGEWKQINATGDDLRKSLVPLPIKEPSQVLFSLLGYLVEYGERLSSVSDMMVGKTPGQNTPATTAMAALEEGMRVFTAIYKRVYRAMANEFKILYRLNQEYLNPVSYFMVLDTGEDEEIYQKDYLGDASDIKPSADPVVASDMQRYQRAEFVAQRAAAVPGYNIQAVERRLLGVMQIDNVDEIYPIGEQAIQQPEDPKMEIEAAKLEVKSKDIALKHERERVKIELAIYATDADIRKIDAEIVNLLADAESKEAGIQLDEYKAHLEDLKTKREMLNDLLGSMNDGGRVSGMAEPSNNQGSAPIPEGREGGDTGLLS